MAEPILLIRWINDNDVEFLALNPNWNLYVIPRDLWEDIQLSITYSQNLEKFGHSKIGLYSLQDQAPQTKRQEWAWSL